MTAGLPPWRVFDAPATDATETSGGVGRGDASPANDAGRRSPTPGLAASLIRRPDVLAATAAALGGLVLAWFLATGGAGGSTSLGGGTELISDPSGSGGSTARGVVVDVVGAVLRPGVYHLPSGSRVADAISAAGGYGPRVAAERVERDLNLAALVHDGEQVVVPSRDVAGSPAPIAASGGPGGGLIDLNTATASELDTLPGIGPVTAAKIVASRSGEPFRAVRDLLDRKLVSQKTFDSIKALVTVG